MHLVRAKAVAPSATAVSGLALGKAIVKSHHAVRFGVGHFLALCHRCGSLAYSRGGVLGHLAFVLSERLDLEIHRIRYVDKRVAFSQTVIYTLWVLCAVRPSLSNSLNNVGIPAAGKTASMAASATAR